MTLSIYSIMDQDTKKFTMPIFAENDAVAKRQFLISCKSLPEELVVAMDLFRVGDVNMDIMDFSNYEMTKVMSGVEAFEHFNSKKESN